MHVDKVNPSEKILDNTHASQIAACARSIITTQSFLDTIPQELIRLKEIVSDGSS